jgi:hypothetical protein
MKLRFSWFCLSIKGILGHNFRDNNKNHEKQAGWSMIFALKPHDVLKFKLVLRKIQAQCFEVLWVSINL